VLITQAVRSIVPDDQTGTVAGVSTEQAALTQVVPLPSPTNLAAVSWDIMNVPSLGFSVQLPSQGITTQSSDGNTLSVTDSNGLLFRVNRIELDPATDLSAWLRKVERDNREFYRFSNATLAGLTGRVGQPIATSGDTGVLFLLFQTDGKTSTHFYQVWVRQSLGGDTVGQDVYDRLLHSFTVIQ